MSDIFSADKSFADLGLSKQLLKALEALSFTQPTVIQSELIPVALQGRDVLGQARTGTGKTAAFALPVLQMCNPEERRPQALILAPTRELAIQVCNEIIELGRHTGLLAMAVYGGGSLKRQAEKLEKGRHIIVGTPGRVMDLHQRGILRYDNMRFAILDEVDRMLDIGFRDDIRKILSEMKGDLQTIFVSATISPDIDNLARRFMKDPVKIVATSGSLTVSQVEQYYLPVQPWDKKRLLHHLLKHKDPEMTVVFCRTKRMVDELARYLNKKKINTHAIHGDMYQGKRNRTIQQLREGKMRVLIASDVAARGLDVAGISHVVNYDLPEDPEIYVHRIGRTARTGRKGVAWSFVTPDQGHLLTAIEKLINREVPRMEYDDFKPNESPEHARGQKSRKDKPEREEKKKRENNEPPAKQPEKVVVNTDPERFPGGLVPSRKPKRTLRGTTRPRRGRR